MSYILDALQKAEAERERGRVPGLKSQLVPPTERDRAGATPFRPWHLAGALAVMLVASGAWWLAGDEPLPVSTAAAPPASPPDDPIATEPAPAVPMQTAEPTTNPQRAEPPREPVQPILAPPRPAPVANPSPPAAAPAPVPSPTPAVTGGATAAAAAPAATKAASAVPTFGELTPEARAQLPAVNVSGSTYSQNPTLRMLIANGKVVQEGQDIAPGLRLETIGPRSAVLNHQGLRYSIGY